MKKMNLISLGFLAALLTGCVEHCGHQRSSCCGQMSQHNPCACHDRMKAKKKACKEKMSDMQSKMRSVSSDLDAMQKRTGDLKEGCGEDQGHALKEMHKELVDATRNMAEIDKMMHHQMKDCTMKKPQGQDMQSKSQALYKKASQMDEDAQMMYRQAYVMQSNAGMGHTDLHRKHNMQPRKRCNASGQCY